MTEDRHCRFCGAILGGGEVDTCSVAHLEFERRGIAPGMEPRVRSRTDIAEIGPIKTLLTHEEIS